MPPTLVATAADMQRFCGLACPSALTPEIIARQHPDAQWLLADSTGEVTARCSLWWSDTPPYRSHDAWSQWQRSHSQADRHESPRLGLIGHFAARDSAAAVSLLDYACEQLTQHACTIAVGPMDGNTWQRYRLMTERRSESTFFLEPDNPDGWPSFFTASGFTPLAHYHSALNPDLHKSDPRANELAQQFQTRGIALRTIQIDRFDDELRSLHALSLASFDRNFLYTPIDEGTFIAQYRGVQKYVQPELVLLAECGAQLIGFIFAIPDLMQAKRGQPIDTAIIKTMAVHPAFGGLGLGTLLMTRCQEAAHALGFRRAIHALFHEANASGKISRHSAQVIRRYTLFAKPLM